MALNTIRYYLASPLQTGVTVETEGWSTEIPVLTDINKYLWIRNDTQTTFDPTLPYVGIGEVGFMMLLDVEDESDISVYGTPYNTGINIEKPSVTFLNEMYNDNRNFIYNAYIVLADSTILNFTNEELSFAGVSIEEAVSEESKLELGSAIINKCTLTVRNFDGIYDIYDFQDAKVILSIGLEIEGEIEAFQRGVYYINEQNFNNALLVLTGLDSMSLFERPYTESLLTYPATIQEIIEDACSVCDVEFNGADFLNSTLLIEKQPTIQGLTFRDVIAWSAQCCACNARVNNLDQLILKYYDFALLTAVSNKLLEPWTDVVELTTEDEEILQIEDDDEDIILDVVGVNIFHSLYSINTAFNDTTITGVRIRIENPEYIEDVNEPVLEYASGTDNYELIIENNGLISQEIAQQIVDSIGNALIGATYRKANFTHLSDPVATAGDVAIIYDGHENNYKVLISSTTFTAGARQTTFSAGATPPRIPAQRPDNLRTMNKNTKAAPLRSVPAGTNVKRFSNQTKQYIQTLNGLSPKFAAMGGLYATDVEAVGGGIIHYLHNKMNLSDSDIRMVISDNGIHATDQGLSENPEWYGMEVDGTFIANILATHGINAEWIQTGAFVVYDDEYNPIFVADKDGGTFTWDMTHSRLSSDGYLTLYASNTENAVGLRVTKKDPDGNDSQDQTIEIGADGIHAEGLLSTEYEYSFNFTVTDPPMIRFSANDSNGVPHELMVNLDTYINESTSYASGIWWDGYSLTKPLVTNISAPGTITDLTRGTTWNAHVSKAGCTVTLDLYFDGRITTAATTALTLFTLASEYRPTNAIRLMRITQDGTRYVLVINTNGTVTIANASGAAMSSNSYFGENVTWVRSV